MRLHEVVNREVILPVIEPCAAPDDLLELDHRVDGPHQDDVADVAGIYAGGEFLRRGQDRGDGFLVVLKCPQVLLAKFAVVCRDALAIVRFFACLELVDEVADEQRVGLVRAEDQRLFVLVDLREEDFYTLLFTFADLDAAVEVRLFIHLPRLDLTLHHGVVGRVNVVIKRRLNLLHLERREEAVVDAFLERVDIDRLAEVGVGVHVVFALGRGGEAELHGRREVIEDVAPVAFVIRAAAMALINDDEIEEVRRILAKVGRRFPILGRAAHEGLKDGKEQAAVLGHAAFLANVLGLDAHQRVVGKGGERSEIIVGLRRERVAVGQKQNARATRRLDALVPLDQIPTRLEQFPRNLESDGCFPRARGQRQENARLPGDDPLQHPIDRGFLIEADGPTAALVGERHGGETVAPRVRLREGHGPEFVWRGVGGDFAFLARLHVDGVDALAVGGVGEAHGHLARVILGLAHTFRQRFVPRLGLVHGQLAVAIDQHVIGGERLAAFAVAFDAARRDGIFAQDFAAFHDAPARRFQCGINVLGAGLGFVHGC